jgi:cytoskeletal protein RodZ
MGISDDIRPKRPRKRNGVSIETKPVLTVSDEPKEDLEKVTAEKDPATLFFEKKKELKKEIDSNIAKTEESPNPVALETPNEQDPSEETIASPTVVLPQDMPRKKSFWGWIIWPIILIIAGFLIYKNLDQIKKFIRVKFLDTTSTQTISNDNRQVHIYTPDTDTSTGTTDSASSNTSTESSSFADSTTTPSTTTNTGTSATTTPTTTIAKSSIKIEILNGSGITGAAATVKTAMETAGLTISYVGNAKNYNYNSTYIYYNSAKEAEARLVNETLSKTRTTVLEASNTIAKNYDVVIVVGKK